MEAGNKRALCRTSRFAGTLKRELRRLIVVLALLPAGCSRKVEPAMTSPPPPQLAPPGVYTSKSAAGTMGMVVSVSEPASEVGINILKRGGNAVDAAVAAAFALVATYPAAGNIGGGGFMLVHPAPGGGNPLAIDYRETAPAAATPDMFVPSDTMYEPKAVATPGTVRGMELAHRRFGTMAWADLLAPAVVLARDGFAIDDNLANLLNTYLSSEPRHAEFLRVFGKADGKPWHGGDRLVQPDLARTLELLAAHGPDAFYTGALAEDIAAEMKQGNGLITARDLADYRARECQPLATRYRGKYDIYAPPSPSAGGVCLIEELNILNAFDLKSWDRWSPATMHVMVEAMRRANHDRARWVGDPAFVDIPPELVTPDYGSKLAATIDLRRATRSVDLSADIPLSRESHDTTHLSIIDRNGMAVSNTYTLERLWGSRIVVKGRGFLLNNNMFGFNQFPGHTDTQGMLGTAPNVIAPGKRPISSMAPVIVSENGRVKLVTGSPGSQGIPHTLLCIIVNVLDFNMPLTQAVDAPRMSHAWFPDEITFEAPERYPELVKSLQTMGHTVVRTGPRPQGDAHTILVRAPNSYLGVADARRTSEAAAVGY